MCGIFAFIGTHFTEEQLREYFTSIAHRGPDNSVVEKITEEILLVFHRLSIMGLDHDSDQPMKKDGLSLICNGEIYSFRKSINEFGFDYQSHSDCEIILHLFQRVGIAETMKRLDDEFAFVLYDENAKKVYIGRDPLGIRSLYYGVTEHGEYAFSSEMKGLGFCKEVKQFPPGHWGEISDLKNQKIEFHRYYDYEYKRMDKNLVNEEEMYGKIRELFTEAVNKRMMSDRKVCCLLSGGIDSSLVSAVVNQHFKPGQLDTYSIGLAGSVDLYYARLASDYMKTNHHEIIVTEEEFLGGIEKTIKQIESFDTTSVRASTGNFLVSLFIKECNKDKVKPNDDVVVFCGDLADEIFASYRGFMKADTPENFYRENLKLIKDVHTFDVLRSDKSISGAGLEARVPFCDQYLMDYVMSIPPELKMFNDKKIEKYILRKAFEETRLLPEQLLWRRKEAFSDGVSGHERSWFQIIKEFVDKQIPDEEYETRRSKFTYMQPYDKESLYYREIFEKYYPNREKTIPYFWRHPFTTNLDPSARLLDVYKDNEIDGKNIEKKHN
jgi:asparagine synthase (glutamine-hydrolysing)